MNTTNVKPRVLVIGLDGATFGIINPMIKNGKLPNFARIMRQGSFGPLKSTMPPITPCAWTSFSTGKDPSKHGLYDFKLHEGDPENTKSVNRTFAKSKALWKILTDAGKKSIVIDVPLTYPPEEINGILISRIMAPPKKNCTYPKSLYYTLRKKGFVAKEEKKIAKEHGADKANVEEMKVKFLKLSKAKTNKLKREKIEKSFVLIKNEIDKNIELATWVMKEKPWDFFMVVFMSADHAGHTFWKDQPKVRRIYEKLDAAVGKLFELAGENTTKFIMSDHGFTSTPQSFNINEWLHKKGLLFKKLDVYGKESIKEIKEFLKHSKQKTKKENKLKNFRYIIKTDYNKTRAYLQSGTSYGVRINLEGRDKTGIVKKEEYESFRSYLINEFRNIKHPISKEKVFSHIFKKEDVYSKSNLSVDPAPDIFLLTPDMKIILEGQFRQFTKVFKKTSTGYGFHHTHGIFFAQGKDIGNVPLDSPKITDLAPTILHILNIPLPDDLDGVILTEILKPGSECAKRLPQYQGSSQVEEKEKVYSKAEEADVEERLRALGYVE